MTVWWIASHLGGTPPPEQATENKEVVTPLQSPKGFIDIVVWEPKNADGKQNPQRLRRQLQQLGALPLRPDHRCVSKCRSIGPCLST